MDEAELLRSAMPNISPSASFPITSSDTLKKIDEKRAELELKKLQLEIDRLQSPNTSIDYFNKMLELQQKNFDNNMQMLREKQDIEIRLAKLEAGGETGDDWIFELLPMLPELIKQRQQQQEKSLINPAGSSIIASINKDKGGKMMIPTDAEIEEYKKKIKSGEVTEEQFITDVKMQYPDILQKLPRERLIEEFNKLKNDSKA
jgi:hypothetical protein